MNDGVEETPPHGPSQTVSGGSSELFVDLAGANVGFQYWHPVPVTADGGRLAGQSEMGGVWEWTSSVLEKYEGFEPLALYPGYTGRQPVAWQATSLELTRTSSGLFRRQAQYRPGGLLGDASPHCRQEIVVSFHLQAEYMRRELSFSYLV